MDGDEFGLLCLLDQGAAFEYVEGFGLFSSEELWGQRKKEFVGEPRRDQGVVEGRAAFYEEHVNGVALF